MNRVSVPVLNDIGRTKFRVALCAFQDVDDAKRKGYVVETTKPVALELTEAGYRHVFYTLVRPLNTGTIYTLPPEMSAVAVALETSPRFANFLSANWAPLNATGIVEMRSESGIQEGPLPTDRTVAIGSAGGTFMVPPAIEFSKTPGTSVAVAWLPDPAPGVDSTPGAAATWYHGTISGPGPSRTSVIGSFKDGPNLVDFDADEVAVGTTASEFVRRYTDAIQFSEGALSSAPGCRAILYSNQHASMATFVEDYNSVAAELGLWPLSGPVSARCSVRHYVDCILPHTQ